MTDDRGPVYHQLSLPNSLTVGELLELLARCDRADRIVGDTTITLITAHLTGEDVEDAVAASNEPDPIAAALEVPHLPAVARHLSDLTAPPGRPRVLTAATALDVEVSRPAADRIVATLAGLPWPPVWLPHLPAGPGR